MNLSLRSRLTKCVYGVIFSSAILLGESLFAQELPSESTQAQHPQKHEQIRGVPRLFDRAFSSARKRANFLSWYETGINFSDDEMVGRCAEDQSRLEDFVRQQTQRGQKKLDRVEWEIKEEGEIEKYSAILLAYLGHKQLSWAIGRLNLSTSGI